jgi:hypothetical protein
MSDTERSLLMSNIEGARMPDGDVISRGIRFAWRSAYEGLQAQDTPEVVAGRLSKAITRTLRVNEGCPSFEAHVEVLEKCARGELTHREAFVAIRTVRVEKDALGSAVAQAAMRCLSSPADVDPRHDLARAVAAEVVEAHLLAKAVPMLVEDSGIRPADANRYVDSCRLALEADLLRIANQIAATPEGRRYRAPARRRQRRSTAELLNEAIG